MKKHVLDRQQRQYRGHSPRLHLHLHLHLRYLHMKKHVLDRQQRQYRGHSPRLLVQLQSPTTCGGRLQSTMRLHLHLHLLAQTAKQQALAQA